MLFVIGLVVGGLAIYFIRKFVRQEREDWKEIKNEKETFEEVKDEK